MIGVCFALIGVFDTFVLPQLCYNDGQVVSDAGDRFGTDVSGLLGTFTF